MATPKAERLKWTPWAIICNLAALFALLRFCASTTHLATSTQQLVVAGWVASVIAATLFERLCPAIPALLACRAALHQKCVTAIPFVAAISLIPAFAIELALVRFDPQFLQLAIMQWSVVCSLLLAELLLKGLSHFVPK